MSDLSFCSSKYGCFPMSDLSFCSSKYGCFPMSDLSFCSSKYGCFPVRDLSFCYGCVSILQYGFIYNTLRSLVVDNHGEEVWLKIW